MTKRELCRELASAGVQDCISEADIIFRELEIPAGGNCDEDVLAPIIKRRSEGEPLQYILGYTYFYREKYKVTKDVLIPRFDTEILVDYAVGHIPEGEKILDICTGSGCVGISALKNSEAGSAVLLDISEAALKVAFENAVANGVSDKVELLSADCLKELPPGEFFAILSNPPYVTEEEYSALERELYFEPRLALVGGEDGLDFYRSLIPRLSGILKPGGFIAFEIGCKQAEALTELGRQHGYTTEIIKDYSSLPRVAVLRRVT